MIAVSFALPEVKPVLLRFIRSFFVEILQKAQYNHFADLKLEVFAGQKYFVFRNIGKHPLLMRR